MLDLLATAQQASPVPSLANAPAPNPVGLAVVKQMSEVNTRLFNNPIGPMSFNEFCDFTHEHAIAPERLREIFEKG